MSQVIDKYLKTETINKMKDSVQLQYVSQIAANAEYISANWAQLSGLAIDVDNILDTLNELSVHLRNASKVALNSSIQIELKRRQFQVLDVQMSQVHQRFQIEKYRYIENLDITDEQIIIGFQLLSQEIEKLQKIDEQLIYCFKVELLQKLRAKINVYFTDQYQNDVESREKIAKITEIKYFQFALDELILKIQTKILIPVRKISQLVLPINEYQRFSNAYLTIFANKFVEIIKQTVFKTDYQAAKNILGNAFFYKFLTFFQKEFKFKYSNQQKIDASTKTIQFSTSFQGEQHAIFRFYIDFISSFFQLESINVELLFKDRFSFRINNFALHQVFQELAKVIKQFTISDALGAIQYVQYVSSLNQSKVMSKLMFSLQTVVQNILITKLLTYCYFLAVNDQVRLSELVTEILSQDQPRYIKLLNEELVYDIRKSRIKPIVINFFEDCDIRLNHTLLLLTIVESFIKLDLQQTISIKNILMEGFHVLGAYGMQALVLLK